MNFERLSLKSKKETKENSHSEAMEFVTKHRDFLEHYARGKVNFKPAPEGLDTFAFDLKENIIYINSRFYKTRGFSDEKTAFATLHETEHFLEKKVLLGEEGGERIFDRYLKRIEKSQAYGLMDNCLADIRENKSVVANTNVGYSQLEVDLYKNDLFKESDFTKEPEHIQFLQAILRESRLPDERCEVSPAVREKLVQFYGIKSKDGDRLADVMTDPATPMSMRFKLQDYYVWPIVQEFLEKDLEEKKQKEGEENGGEGAGEEKAKKRKGNKGNKGEKSAKKEKPDPNEVFKDAYKRAKEKMPEVVPFESIKKSFKEWQKSQGENSLEVADKEYAEKLGVKKDDLLKYRKIVESLGKIINSETGENIIQELRSLIERIIAKRLKPALAPRYPVEEGEELTEPAQAVAEVKAGELQPKVWETYEIKEQKGKQFGEVEITLVCDRSDSMEKGAKLSEQQRAAVFLMEALKEFSDRIEEEKVNLQKPLEIRSEIYSFQQDLNDSIPLKKISGQLGEKERVEVAAVLSSAPGGTTDFIPLETIHKNLNDDDKKKIAEGELKKIVIIFTDGESNDAGRVKNILKDLRGIGIVAVGVGITKEGESALKTYAPDARLAMKAEDLAMVLVDLLKDHLADL